MKKNIPTLSVIVPMYNAADFIGECLGSLVTQTFEDIEIIVINDGSTDDSMAVVEGFLMNKTNIIILNQKNTGVSAARNRGIKVARGKYILFVDADDYLTSPEAINEVVSSHSLDSELTIFGILYEGRELLAKGQNLIVKPKNINDYLAHLIANEELNSPCNKLYLKKIIINNNIRFDENIEIGEDLLFNINYVDHCTSIKYLSEQLYFYRNSNESSATKKYRLDKYKQLMLINDRLYLWSKERKNFKLKNATTYIRIKNILSCARDLSSPNCDLSNKHKLNLVRVYKGENSRLIVRGMGVKKLVISILYSVCSPSLLIKITSRMPK